MSWWRASQAFHCPAGGWAPCPTLQAVAPELRRCFTLRHLPRAARTLMVQGGLWQRSSRRPLLWECSLAQGQGSNFCLRLRLISGGLAFEELSFKTASPTSCARIMFSPEISARVWPWSPSQGASAVHHSWQLVHSVSNRRLEASFWESTI